MSQRYSSLLELWNVLLFAALLVFLIAFILGIQGALAKAQFTMFGYTGPLVNSTFANQAANALTGANNTLLAILQVLAVLIILEVLASIFGIGLPGFGGARYVTARAK